MCRLRRADLDEIVDAAYIDWLLRADDTLRDAGRHELVEWESTTKGAYLSDLALTHHWKHYGEALTIRRLCAMKDSAETIHSRMGRDG